MFKVSFDKSQVAKVEAKFKADVQDILSQKAVLNDVGDFLVDRLKYQARTQEPYSQTESFPELKDSTVKSRKYLSQFNQTQDTYAAGRSNVTFTGALLNSLTALIKGPGEIEISFQGTHPRYNGKNGPIGREESNADIATWLAQKGFKIFDKSIATNETIKSRIKTIAQGYLRRGLKVRNKL